MPQLLQKLLSLQGHYLVRVSAIVAQGSEKYTCGNLASYLLFAFIAVKPKLEGSKLVDQGRSQSSFGERELIAA